MRGSAGRALGAALGTLAVAAALGAAPAAGAAPPPPKSPAAATAKPRPLALTDAADKALRAELARRGLKPSAVEPQLEALRAADPWVALVQGAERIGSASAFAYMALDQAFAELGVPPEQRMALAGPGDAGDQLAALGAQMKLFEDPALSIPEAWRASFAQLALDLARARRLAAKALAGFDEKERRELYSWALDASAFVNLRGALDAASLARASLTALLATDAFLAAYPRDLPPDFAWRTDVPGVDGPALGPFATAAGPFYIGGVADNVWSLAEHAVVVDLGGPDLHAPRPPLRPATTGAELSVIVDVNGDDRYESDISPTLGGAVFGLSVLRDEAGDDSYRGERLTQGAASFGAGLLVDAAGSDRYEAERAAQGAGFMGIGLLVDGSGDDVYVLGAFGQAAGSHGVGVLADLSGRDIYVDSVSTADRAIQGSGNATGGLGLPGRGAGILLEVGGDDVYRAFDRAQGFAWAEATGLLIDGAGNDTYLLEGEGQGCGDSLARDPGPARGVLIDFAGDDARLVASGQAQAATAHASVVREDHLATGIGVLIDAGGSDWLRCGDATSCRGVAAGDGRALFIDLGVKPAVTIGVPPKPAPSGKVAK